MTFYAVLKQKRQNKNTLANTMKTQIKEVTPQWALNILNTRNPRNRPMSAPFVERLALDIKNNAWALTHQGIAFDANGDLLDGQHRLAAVAKAGVPVDMLITTGVPTTAKLNGLSVNTFELIDGGRKRGVGQMLHMSGYINANRLAAVARVMVNLCANTGHFLSLTTAQTHKAIHIIGPSAEKCVALACAAKMRRPPSGATAACAFWHTTHPQMAEEFLDEVGAITGQKKSASRAVATWIARHPSGGGASAVEVAKVTASGIYHQTKNSLPEKLYASYSATAWLLSLNPALKGKLAAIVKL